MQQPRFLVHPDESISQKWIHTIHRVDSSILQNLDSMATEPTERSVLEECVVECTLNIYIHL